MSPIGRIFVVVNLALAAAFLGWASQTLANAHKYRGLYDETTATLESTKKQLQDEISTLTAARDEARRQKDETIQRNAQLANDITSKQQAIEALTDEKNRLNADISGINATLKDYNDNATRLAQDLKAAADARAAADQARHEAENARQAAMQAQRNAEAAQADAEGRVRKLQEDLASANDELQQRDTIIAAYTEYTDLTIDEVAGNVQTIPAAVVGVLQQDGQTLVHLNKGTQDGVKRGYKFWIYNGATLKGMGRVEVVNATTATAVMIDPVPGRSVAQGDRATTRL